MPTVPTAVESVYGLASPLLAPMVPRKVIDVNAGCHMAVLEVERLQIEQ